MYKTLIKVAATAAFLIASANVMAQTKIGFVSNERILRESAYAKQVSAKLENEFKKRKTDLDASVARARQLAERLDKDAAVLSEAERTRRQRELQDLDRDLQRRGREYQEDLNQRQNEELAVLLERANRAIRQIADQEKYDIIVQEAVYANPRVDITDRVLKILDAMK